MSLFRPGWFQILRESVSASMLPHLDSLRSALSVFSTFSSVKHCLVTLQSLHRRKGEQPLSPIYPSPYHCHFPTNPLPWESARPHSVLGLGSLLTRSSLFYEDTLETSRVDFRNVARGCQGCACFFKATRFGTPPALELQIHSVPSRGNFHYNLLPLATISRQALFSGRPSHPISRGGTLFPPFGHQLSPAFDFLVSGCWGKTRTHRVQWSNPLLTMFCICKSYFRTSFLRLN